MTCHHDHFDHLYKLVLVGDAAVGKTHILSRYIKGSLPKQHYPTIGVEFATQNVPLKSGGVVKAQIWDTAGQERYQAITAAHYRGAVGALVVYDITKESSFNNVKKWITALKNQAGDDIVIMLVGRALKVSYEDAYQYAKMNHLLFNEASAFTNVNIKDSFETLVETIFNERSKVTEKTIKKGVNLSSQPQTKTTNKGMCCQ